MVFFILNFSYPTVFLFLTVNYVFISCLVFVLNLSLLLSSVLLFLGQLISLTIMYQDLVCLSFPSAHLNMHKSVHTTF